MPDPRRTPRLPRVSRPEAPIPAKLSRPPWAESLHAFYDPSFDVKSADDLADAADDFADLSEGEQAYHIGQLLFRQALGLEAIQATLHRIEALVASQDVSALKHLAPIRVAVRDLAEGQDELLGVIDQIGAFTAAPAEPSEDAEEVIDDEDHGLGDAGDDEASERSELSEEMNPVVPFRRRTHATTVIDIDPHPKESA